MFIMMWEVEKTLQGLSGIGSYTDNQCENGRVRSFHRSVYCGCELSAFVLISFVSNNLKKTDLRVCKMVFNSAFTTI